MSEFASKRKVKVLDLYDFEDMLRKEWLEWHQSTDGWTTDGWVDDIKVYLSPDEYEELLDDLRDWEKEYNAKIELKADFKGGAYIHQVIIRGFKITFNK